MATTGNALRGQFLSAISELEREHDTFGAQVKSCEKRIQVLVDERDQIYSRLATVYLPELSAQSVINTLREMQTTVQECFERKQLRRKQLEELLQQVRERRDKETKRLSDLNEEFEKHSTERGRLETIVSGELKADALYLDAKRIADQTQRAFDGAKARAEAFRQESTAKLAAYDAEPLFQYLAKVDYGTASYHAFPLVAALDGWVAGMVNFRESKKNFDRLKALPQFIDDEIQRQQLSLNQVVGEMRRIEDVAAAKHGLDKTLAQGKALAQQRTQVTNRIAALDADFQKQTADLQQLDGSKDDFHRQALEQMKGFLRCESLTKLREMAKSTPTRNDDVLVQRLEEIDQEIAAQKKESSDAQLRQRDVAENVSKVSRMENWYTTQNYDSSRSRFRDGFDFQGLLSGFLLGQIADDIFRSTVQQDQYFEQRSSHRSSRQYASSGSDSSSGGWDFGGSSGGGGGSSDSSFSGGGGDSGGGGGGFSSSDSMSSGGYSSSDSF